MTSYFESDITGHVFAAHESITVFTPHDPEPNIGSAFQQQQAVATV